MPIIPKVADYTDKDFDSIKVRLRNLISSVFPEWSDFNRANFGNILLELYAHVGDILGFYQDGQARQSRIATATQRRAMLGLVKLLGYVPATATAATADVTITLATPPLGEARFPAGSFIRTEDPSSAIRYQLLDDAVITAGQNPATVTVAAENSESKQQLFVASGLPNQEVVLSEVPYIDGSAVIVAGNGAFTQVANFLSSTSDDRHYTIQVDQNDRATIRFGNGVNGAKPVGSGSVSYKIGGGAAGRVEMNKLRAFENSTWTDSLGNPLSPSVTNPEPSSGGTNRQSVDQIREYAPASLRALTRSIAREDFEINALRLPSVARALMLTRNEDPSIGENTGFLFVVPVGGGLPSEELKAQVLNQVTVVFPQPLTFTVQVRDPVYKVVDVAMIAYFRRGVTKATVAAAIRAELATFFAPQTEEGDSNTDIDFGGNVKNDTGEIVSELALSDVLNVCRDVAGVRKIGSADGDFLLNLVHDDVALERKEFPKLGTVTITDGDTGDNL